MRILRPASIASSISTIVVSLVLSFSSFISASEVTRRCLPNGVVAIVEERHDIPIIALRIYVRTGSIYEGKYLGSGISHLLEHLFFVGTKTRSKRQILDLREDIGNAYNGFTGHELMHFFLVVSPESFQRALDLFSDCVKHLTLPPDELSKEREVIHEEMDTWRNRLTEVLRCLQYQTMFRVHPVRYPIKGDRERLDRLTRADVLAYYKSAFRPENVVVVVVGDIEEGAAFDLITQAFGDMQSHAAPVGQAGSSLLRHTTGLPEEPAQQGMRRATLERKGIKTAYLSMAYRTVSITHEDAPALDLLATMLTETRNAFLSRLLLGKRRLAYNVKAYISRPGADTGMLAVRVILRPTQVDAAEKAILDGIEGLKSRQIDPAMLQEAKKLLRARQVFNSETVQDRANQLGMDEVKTGDYLFSDRYLERLQQASVEDVRRALNKYFSENNLSVATIVPPRAGTGYREHDRLGTEGHQKAARRVESKKTGKRENGGPHISHLPLFDFLSRPLSLALAKASPAEDLQSKQQASRGRGIRAIKLRNGVKVLLKQNRAAPSAAIVAAFGGGVGAETKATSGISNLLASLLLKQTASRTGSQITGAINRRGGRIRAFAEEDAFGVIVNCLKEDLPLALEIVADICQNATISEDHLARERRMLLGAIRRRDDNPLKLALVKFRLAAASKRWPRGRNRKSYLPKLGTEESVKQITFEDIFSFHNQYCAPNNLVLSICGDVDYARVGKQIEALFDPDDWPARPLRQADKATETVASAVTSRDHANSREQSGAAAYKVVIEKPGIPQAAIYFGYPGVALTDPDSYALDVLDGVLSGIRAPGGRLHRRLRDKGLVYVVHAKNEMHRDGGFFRGYALCALKNVNAVLNIIAEEMYKIRDQPISEKELRRGKTMCVTLRGMDHQTNESQAKQAALDAICGTGYTELNEPDFTSGYLEPPAYMDGVRSVTREDVERVAREYLNSELMITIIIRPKGA